MEFREQAAQLRKAIAAAGPANARRRVPVATQHDVARYAAARRAQAATQETISRELGISATTLKRWSAGRPVGRTPAFRAVAVIPPPTPVAPLATHVVVVGPAGVRIEGLDVAALAALLRSLA